MQEEEADKARRAAQQKKREEEEEQRRRRAEEQSKRCVHCKQLVEQGERSYTRSEGILHVAVSCRVGRKVRLERRAVYGTIWQRRAEKVCREPGSRPACERACENWEKSGKGRRWREG